MTDTTETLIRPCGCGCMTGEDADRHECACDCHDPDSPDYRDLPDGEEYPDD